MCRLGVSAAELVVGATRSGLAVLDRGPGIVRGFGWGQGQGWGELGRGCVHAFQTCAGFSSKNTRFPTLTPRKFELNPAQVIFRNDFRVDFSHTLAALSYSDPDGDPHPGR